MNDPHLDLVVRGGTLVTTDGRSQADVGIRDGVVAQLGGAMTGARELDATGRLVLPGGVDPHVHLYMEPMDDDPRWVDDFTSGSEAAFAGGITSLGNMTYVLPWETITQRMKADSAVVDRQAMADVFLHAAIVAPTAETVAEAATMTAAGHSSIKIFMTLPTFESSMPQFTLVMKATADAGGITLIHCEDQPTIECCTAMLVKNARTSLHHYHESRPVSSEVIATERAIAMCRATGAPTYIVHLSSARALAACVAARAEGLPVYVETRPLYLYMTEERYDGADGPLYVAQPPLRAASDLSALWAGLIDGSIDTLASDHAPWTRALKMEAKLDINQARPGVAELDTMLPLLYTEGVATGRLSLERFVALTSTNAARLFGLYPRKGTIAVGSDADLVIWETRERRTIRDSDLFSRAGHTVYQGRQLAGWPRTTLRRGEIVFDDGKVTAKPGSGQMIPRGRSQRLPPASAR